jgi:hypothetical protein
MIFIAGMAFVLRIPAQVSIDALYQGNNLWQPYSCMILSLVPGRRKAGQRAGD